MDIQWCSENRERNCVLLYSKHEGNLPVHAAHFPFLLILDNDDDDDNGDDGSMMRVMWSSYSVC